MQVDQTCNFIQNFNYQALQGDVVGVAQISADYGGGT
jgi:DNA-directed RNA polymerase